MTAQTQTIPQTAAGFHVSVERNVILKALSHCQGVVEKRNTVPILANVLLDAGNHGLKMMATDLDLALVECVAATVLTPGTITVSAQMLYDITRKLKDGALIDLHLDEAQGRLTLKSGRSTFDLTALPATDFPSMDAGMLPHSFKLQTNELIFLIDKARSSMSTEETRYYLNGIYMHTTEDGLLRAVSTDGHRLARAHVTCPEGAQGMAGVIISRKTIGEVRKLLDDSSEEIEISLSPTQISFKTGESVLISRLIEGNFPDYQRVIPASNENILEVDASLLTEAVDRASLVATDKMRLVKLHAKPGLLQITAFSSDAGSSVEELEVAYNGPQVEFGFNARYILDITQQLAGCTLQFLIGDESQAIIVKEMGDESSLYVLMPLRV